MKKIISLILALTICLSCGVFAFATDTTYEDSEEVVAAKVMPRYREYLECTVAYTPVWKYISKNEDEIPPIVCYMKKGDRATMISFHEISGEYFCYVKVESNGFLGYVLSSHVKNVIE